MTFIKICGITNLPDALAALEAGADALGFNFYRPSSRYVEPAVARKIIEEIPKPVLTVGVFVNEDDPRSIADEAGVSALQLHGDESPSYCKGLSDRHVIKTFAVDENFDVNIVLEYEVVAVMLDARHQKLRGGTGHVIDWSVARRVNALDVPMFLAGGLSPENVQEAIRIVNPYAVDACSSLESEPGKKDHDRLREFIERARFGE